MIPTLLFFGLLAGLDNLQVCSSLGLLPIGAARRRRLAAAFSLCEMAAPVAGVLAGRAALAIVSPYARMAGPAMMIGCGIAVLIAAARGERGETGADSLLFGLPISLSLDNVAAGMGISSLPCPIWVAASAIGLVSAAMSCAGLYGAATIRRRLARLMPARPGVAVGGYLCVLAVRMLIET